VYSIIETKLRKSHFPYTAFMKNLITFCIVGVLLAGCTMKNQENTITESPKTDKTILALGDSLTAGFGLPESDAYPAQLETLLRQKGFQYSVINAGVSGDTSAGLLARIDWVLA
jgi:acyl-CoA thioesterase-1